MKQELKSVYVPKQEVLNEGYSTADFDELKVITFTKKEYNEHIETVIKDALNIAAQRSKMQVQPSEMEEWEVVPDEITRKDVDDEESGCEDFWISINRQSITDTFEETFRNYKL